MAEQKVVALNSGQWKAVVLHNFNMLAQALSNIAAPDDAGLAQIDDFIANTRSLMHGWKVAGQQEAKAQQQAAQTVQVAESSGNGAVQVKRKGGWPKGKKRGQPEAVAQQ